ncbi:MAG: DedA family protein [Gemmatimonadetes bacterium]|nr:DedA family protein [Gemmatimonadota bacterium]
MQSVLHILDGLPPVVIYVFLGAGAAAENIVPPVPADTFVLLGGFLAALGQADGWTVFLVTWGANVASALAVYGAGHRYGGLFFRTAVGRRLLSQRQLSRLRRFYERWGVPAIFFTRFLPGLRAVVPVFAGVTHQRFLAVAVPVAAASALWYGALVWLGTLAGRNLEEIAAWVGDVNRILLLVSVVLAATAAVWWLRTRKHRD